MTGAVTTPARSAAGEPRSAGHGRRAAPGGGTIIGLDIARFLAALSVVLYHYAFFSWHEPAGATGLRAAIGTSVAYPALLPISWWGWVGVEIFFVISGLVICLSAERQSSAAFLRSRILRIAPALWFFATISLLVTFLYSSATVETVLPMYLRSIVLFPRGPWIDGVYWTLTVEAVFYALICLLILSSWITRLQSIARAASMLVLGFYLMVLAARAWPELWLRRPLARRRRRLRLAPPAADDGRLFPGRRQPLLARPRRLVRLRRGGARRESSPREPSASGSPPRTARRCSSTPARPRRRS